MATQLLNNATTTGPGPTVTIRSSTMAYIYKSFQAIGTMSTGTGSSTIKIEVSNDGVNFITLGTIGLTLSTTAATDGFACSVTWAFVRANISAITANGIVTVLMEP